MSKFRDALKQAIKDKLRGSLPSKYRLGDITSLNSDGTCLVMVDGTTVVAAPLYPVVMGQRVVVVKGDSGGFSAIPTRPGPPPPLFEPPPFFSGAEFLRLAMDETFFVGVSPFVPAYRFQDEGSSNLFRVTLADMIGNFATVENQQTTGSGLSPNGRFFAFVFTFENDLTHATGLAYVRVLDIGTKKLSSNTVIDAPSKLFAITPTITKSIQNPINYNTGTGPAATFVQNDGTLFYLSYAAAQNNFQFPHPLPTDNGGPATILETWDGAEFKNSIGLNGIVGTPEQYVFHIFSITGTTFPGLPSWASISAVSGTVVIPGFNNNNPTPYDHILIINTTGLTQGLFHAQVTPTSTSPPETGLWDLYLAMNVTGVTLSLTKVGSDGVPTFVAAVSSTHLNYTSPIISINSYFILDPVKLILAINRSLTEIDIIDMNVGLDNPILTISASFNRGRLSNVSASRTTSISCVAAIKPGASSLPAIIRYNSSAKTAGAGLDTPGFNDPFNLVPQSGNNPITNMLLKANGSGFFVDLNLLTRTVKTGVVGGTPGVLIAGAADSVPDISPQTPGATSNWRILFDESGDQPLCFGLVGG